MTATKHIASAANPFYRTLLKLSRSGRERRKQGMTLLDGVHLVEAYLATGAKPLHTVVAESARPVPQIAAVLARLPAPIVLADGLFESLTDLASPSGLLAVIAIPGAQPFTASDFWVLLEDLQDPGNVGSILRSCAAAGVSDVWLSAGCADCWSPKVLRAAMGAHFFLRLHERADLLQAALRCPGRVVALAPDAIQPIFELDLSGSVALAFGNEGSGLSASLREVATDSAVIPMPGRTESLNVAAAAAVCLFERVRQTAAGQAQAFEVEQVLIPKSV